MKKARGQASRTRPLWCPAVAPAWAGTRIVIAEIKPRLWLPWAVEPRDPWARPPQDLRGDAPQAKAPRAPG